jgi:hypothetical protein
MPKHHAIAAYMDIEINIRILKNSARSVRFTTSQQSRYTLDMNSAIHLNDSASLCTVLSLLKAHTTNIYSCGLYPFSSSSHSE